MRPSAAADLVAVIAPHTAGNPYDTLELFNALRRDGVLTPAAGGWRWTARRCAPIWARRNLLGCWALGWRPFRCSRAPCSSRWPAWAAGSTSAPADRDR